MNGMKRVIEHFGSQAALARLLGVSTQAVHQWQAKVPIARAIQIEHLSNGAVQRQHMRPDIWPSDIPPPAPANGPSPAESASPASLKQARHEPDSPADSGTSGEAASPDPDTIDVPTRQAVRVALMSHVGGIQGWADRRGFDALAVRRALQRHQGKRVAASSCRGADTTDILRALRVLVDDPTGVPPARIEQLGREVGLDLGGAAR